MENDHSITLSIPELRLCLNVLRCRQWDDLPLLGTDEPVEQRLMNAFLHMIQQEYFQPIGDKYKLDQEFSRLIQNIGQADEAYYLYAEQYIVAFLYVKDSVIYVISPDWGKGEQCRIAVFNEMAISEVQMQYSVLSGRTVKTELKKFRKPLSERGKYDLEKLAFFMGDYINWEATK